MQLRRLLPWSKGSAACQQAVTLCSAVTQNEAGVDGQACCASRVVCLSCGRLSDRYAFQEQLKQLNPDAAAAVARMVKAGADKVRS